MTTTPFPTSRFWLWYWQVRRWLEACTPLRLRLRWAMWRSDRVFARWLALTEVARPVPGRDARVQRWLDTKLARLGHVVDARLARVTELLDRIYPETKV